ncbi:hypothetical protein DFJ68_1584 [Terracoccus luteus]|uniref:Uncharacterized protein n=1 Tax=Terracoccus luteus TaxID=53356 RepID=A0A495XZJ0_9MICO|nr:hypothetical protein [Terracoccus luteus]RKT78146.1 hypothetical protein DFJ68_1584 [Terracoccus luteus]
MTTAAATREPAAPPLWSTDRWRWALLAATALLLAVFPFVATAPAALGDLDDAVRDGSVTRVTVTDPLGPEANGFATAQVTWREHGVARAAEVRQVSDATTGGTVLSDGTDRATEVGSVVDHLRAVPGGESLVVDVVDRHGGASFAGWQVPTWFMTAALVVWLLTLALVAGPEPWRGTRWAWFWFVFSPFFFVAVPAFLLLGGRLPWGGTEPRVRRLTGGKAWILVVLATVVLDPLG